MRKAFADTDYWIAMTDPRDMWSPVAARVTRSLRGIEIVTTEFVIIEFLNHFCGFGPYWRERAHRRATVMLEGGSSEVVNATSALIRRGIEHYRERTDKSYSLTDSISMVVMRDEGITDILTHDHHFVQEGFRALLREDSAQV